MSVTEFVISFIFMAVAIMAILVVGTLGAADLLHRPRRSNEAEKRSDSSHLEHQPEDTDTALARTHSRKPPLSETPK